MAQKKTVYGAQASNVAQLLGLGAATPSAGDPGSSDQRKADQLRDYLAAKIPSNRHPITHFPNTIRSAMTESIECYLSQAETGLTTFKEIKAYGAMLGRAAPSDIEKEPAHTIYYAAIAAALTYHQQRITEFSFEALVKSFAQLSELSWTTPMLSTLFQQATEACRKLDTSKETHG